jgi:hypothetical protein
MSAPRGIVTSKPAVTSILPGREVGVVVPSSASDLSAESKPKSTTQDAAFHTTTTVVAAGSAGYNADNNNDDDGDGDDDAALAALGYKSEFKREFSLFTTFCVSFAVLGLLPSFASTMGYGLGYAGTAGEFFLFLYRRWKEERDLTDNNKRHDVGLDPRHDWHPVRCVLHGRAVQFDAHQRRALLCVGGPGAAWLGPVCGVAHGLE